ncbi:DUF2235 domain-containing protein [Candidatus Nitrospira neomarina]|uniref:DUF2235 domain-containing protein n=1 Tax=Candidatus Nitrospira neomarina TaxID=3020899 RepID=A0AA96GK76_9BACT|nr:DUF2235 domain-containing protein [Candidatus Nitrospira neomarina]WNM60513.1 DUF2235 domain-containing protein [Candidatus Nitrospira neomarina]
MKEARAYPPIHFIGVWDTVGALGVPGALGQLFNRNKYKYHDVGLHPTILHAYQALAIDERRKPFAPSVWQRPSGWTGTLEQVWFAGVLSNVGGGYHPDGLANEALHWMVEKAEGLGLEFDKSFLDHYQPCFNLVLQDSMSAMCKVMGPRARLIGQQAGDDEAVHQSAIDRVNLPDCHYDPKNLRIYLSRTASAKVVNTTRIARGTPCA